MTTSARAIRGVPARVDGKFLEVEGRRLLVRGVAYGTFAPGPDGALFPPSAQIGEDFASMAAAGINTVRTYTAPSPAVLDAAAAHGLRLMIGIPWPQHVAFLDDRQLATRIRRDAAAVVRQLADHPAALMFAVGNEIPPAVVRWHGQRRIERFLRELYTEIKSAAPHGLLTYVNFPPTEYLDLDSFDLCAFNVYLHREADLRAYLARLQHIAGSKPLLLAEAGVDSVREGAAGQAELTAMHVRAAFEEGACGAVVFSWTDEWWRGGCAVDDWAFGLVDAERQPKPALAAVERAFADAPFAGRVQPRWPAVSVVVCAYNAAETIDDCLTSLAALTYPDVEIIVVNDGSRDATGPIARLHAGVRVIDVPNGGLSAARNVGLAHANGEIVAYTDADVRVDPDWLTYLVQPLLTQEVVGAGGPNVVPPDDPWVAQCVARAPGGPTHVLIDDRIAEHVPGCNMAFRREALLAIGGFDPMYVRAGDDVDICWRLQARGWRIGFAPAALVWHHHRATVRAFWRQQAGYGEAEAWLQTRHPEKFDEGGMLWHGRIYSALPFLRSLRAQRVNTGVWGTAAFPSVYSARANPLQFLPHSPAWMTVSSALVLIGALASSVAGAVWPLSFGVLGWLTTLIRCAHFGWRSDLSAVASGDRRSRKRLAAHRMLIAWLHVVQPAARMAGRLRGRWSRPEAAPTTDAPPQLLPAASAGLFDLFASVRLLLGSESVRSFWSEAWVAHSSMLADLAARLRRSSPPQRVEIDDGWQPDRDLSVAVGRWGRLHLRVLVEEHSAGRCLVRVASSVRSTSAGAMMLFAAALFLSLAASGASTLRRPPLAAAVVWAVLLIAARGWRQMARAHASVSRAVASVTTDAGMLALPIASASEPRRPPRAAWPGRVAQAAVVAGIIAFTWLAGFPMVNRRVPPRGMATADAAQTTARDLLPGGGVAVGVSGDLFVADARQGVIRRLRPRPPLGTVWTAHDIGTDGYPILGTAVPFRAAADITLAPNGDLYVADARNNRVCRIVRSTGEIVTIAGSQVAGFAGDGGAAVRASLRAPSAVAIAPNGDLYVADTLNNRIRLIARATGIITTVAGDGAVGNGREVGDDEPALRARLSQPTGLAVARNGDLYIADTGHNRVRRMVAATGIMTTVAGDGSVGGDGDGGPAVHARLSGPMGLALVQDGHRLVIYVADSLNNRVRVVEPGGRIATLNASWPLLAPTRIAYHPGGWLYVKDASPDGVRAMATSASTPRKAATTPARHSGRKET